MKLAWDTETALIRPGLAAPPLACVSWADEQLDSGLYHARDSLVPLKRWLGDPSITHLGLNMAYDTAVAAAAFPELLELIFEAYLDGRIQDVGLNQRLLDIANGELDGRWEQNPDYDPSQPTKGRNKPQRWRKNKYALAELALRLWGEYIAKGEDTWRKRYGTLIPVYPLERWQADAQHYAIKDAVKTMQVDLWHWQEGQAPAGYNIADVMVDSGAQAAAAFALHLMTCRGIRTDAASCQALIAAAEAEIQRCRDLCAHTLFDGKQLTATERFATDDAPTLIVPTLKGRKGAKVRSGKWTKNLDNARKYMLGALLRDAGLPSDEEWQAWLVDRVRHFLDTHDEIPKDRHIFIEHEDEEGYAEVKLKLTKTGDISLDAEACKDINDPVLRAYATFTSATTLRSKAKTMLIGSKVPLQGRFQALVATGRTSMTGTKTPLIGIQAQNMRRNAMENELGEELPGQRECIIARDGYVLCSIDYDNAEMRSEGQIAIWDQGYSNLADVLNRGESAHLALACAHLLDKPISYAAAYALKQLGDSIIENATQFAKVPNFALLGGARALTMIPYAKAMNIILSPERSHTLYAAFHAQWTEIAPMHRQVRKALRAGRGNFVFEQWVSKRLRFIERYTVGCNTPFQGLTADAAKSALLWLAAECYTGKEYAIGVDGWRVRATGRLSPLAGAYPMLFAHDEVIFELREERAHEQAFRARDIMVQAYNRFTPDVKMTAEPCLMRRWYKGAKSVYDDRKQLIVWQPKEKKVSLVAA